MSEKIILIAIVCLIIFIAAVFLARQNNVQQEEQLKQRFEEFKVELKNKKSLGYDTYEAERLARHAVNAYQKGEKQKAIKLFEEACIVLGRLKKTISTENRRGKFPDIKTAIVYESIIDQFRDADEIGDIIAETKANYIHRAFFRWQGMAEIERKYNVYGILKDKITIIKQKNPDILVSGALAAQEINKVEYDPLTREVIPENKTWEIALDPQKYGFNTTKKELHKQYWKKTGSKKYILPDITNPDYQKLILNFAKKQIDSGIDTIWIDGLFWQSGILARLAKKEGKDPINHSAVKASFEAASRIVNKIHEYGMSKGKYVYVGSWSSEAWRANGMPKHFYPKLNFVTMSPSAKEIENKKLNKDEWQEKIRLTKEIYGNDIPIIAFIDWAFTKDTPLGVFSQTLNKEEQKEVLMDFDRFFSKNEVIFSYPVHGGYIGRDATKLAFGKYYKYDALAQEFGTYETIKKLAQKSVVSTISQYRQKCNSNISSDTKR